MILEGPVEPNTQTVVITWRGRVVHATEEEVVEGLADARATWRRRDRVAQRAAPAEYRAAAGMRTQILGGHPPTAAALSGAGYASLTLVEHLMAEFGLPPAADSWWQGKLPAVQPEDPSARGSEGEGESRMADDPFSSTPPRLPGLSGPTVHYTRSSRSVPSDVRAALQSNWREKPEAVRSLNVRILRSMLVDELRVGADAAERFLGDAEVVDSLYCLDRIESRKLAGREQRSIYFLLLWSNGELTPWRLSPPRVERIELDGDLILKSMERDLAGRAPARMALWLLLQLHDPRLVPWVDRALLRESDISELKAFFRFYAGIRSTEGCRKVLAAYRPLVSRALTEDAAQRTALVDWAVGWISGLVADVSDADPSKPALVREIQETSERVPALRD